MVPNPNLADNGLERADQQGDEVPENANAIDRDDFDEDEALGRVVRGRMAHACRVQDQRALIRPRVRPLVRQGWGRYVDVSVAIRMTLLVILFAQGKRFGFRHVARTCAELRACVVFLAQRGPFSPACVNNVRFRSLATTSRARWHCGLPAASGVPGRPVAVKCVPLLLRWLALHVDRSSLMLV